MNIVLFLGFIICSPVVCLFLCQYHAILFTVVLYYSLKSGSMMLPALFFLKFALAVWGVLLLHIKFRVVFFYFCGKCYWNFLYLSPLSETREHDFSCFCSCHLIQCLMNRRSLGKVCWINWDWGTDFGIHVKLTCKLMISQFWVRPLV